MEGLELGCEDCERLYTALYWYHQNNRIQPVADEKTVRPNLSFVSLAHGVLVERNIPYFEVDELLDIRRDEQVFSSWRELVRNSVNMAEAGSGITAPSSTFSKIK